MTDKPYEGGAGNPYAADSGARNDAIKDLPQGQRAIWKFIKEQCENGGAGDEGVNIMAVARHVGLGTDQVREMVETMTAEGLLYSGLDDDQ